MILYYEVIVFFFSKHFRVVFLSTLISHSYQSGARHAKKIWTRPLWDSNGLVGLPSIGLLGMITFRAYFTHHIVVRHTNRKCMFLNKKKNHNSKPKSYKSRKSSCRRIIALRLSTRRRRRRRTFRALRRPVRRLGLGRAPPTPPSVRPSDRPTAAPLGGSRRPFRPVAKKIKTRFPEWKMPPSSGRVSAGLRSRPTRASGD